MSSESKSYQNLNRFQKQIKKLHMLKNFTIIRTLGKLEILFLFIINSIIGEGSFGIVYLVKRNSDGQYYALKKVSFENSLLKNNKFFLLFYNRKMANFFQIVLSNPYLHLTAVYRLKC